MAMFDNSKFLIHHVRNSFITSDDTGMCELIIDLDDNNEIYFPEKERKLQTWQEESMSEGLSDSGPESEDPELAHSMDVIPNMDIGHRRRSNTAQRLDKLKRDKHRQSKIKHIQWKGIEGIGRISDDYFERKEVVKKSEDETHTKQKSALSLQLEMFASCPNNPFSEFARFDGKATPTVPTKKLGIFLTMAPPEERSYPMMVVTLSSARVSEVIGLICWQYTVEDREPKLSEQVEAFALYMAEDDGEVDFEFPALDSKEPISKFGFSRLALVQREIPKKEATKTDIVITINLPDRGFSKLVLESDKVLLREVLEKLLVRRKLRQDDRRKYILERQYEPGHAVDLDVPIANLNTFEFCLVRENSSRRVDTVRGRDERRTISALEETLTSHQYASYSVNMINNKVFSKAVQLGISSEKIEVYPMKPTGMFKQKAHNYHIEVIADCKIIETKASGKATFRLIYEGNRGEAKHHDFETDIQTTQHIVKKIGNILELRSSPFRKEHLEKPKRTFSFKRHTLGI